MSVTAKRARLEIKLRCKRDGTTITMRWEETNAPLPDADPTTGARIVEDTASSVPATQKSCTTKGFPHYVQPITSGYRKFAEIEAGDVILDMPFQLYRVTDGGDAGLTVGSVLDELALSQANQDMTNEAVGSSLDAHSLQRLSFEFGGRRWVQKEIGEELSANWDCIYGNIDINRSFLLRLQ